MQLKYLIFDMDSLIKLHLRNYVLFPIYGLQHKLSESEEKLFFGT